jgi:hypothetical protein
MRCLYLRAFLLGDRRQASRTGTTPSWFHGGSSMSTKVAHDFGTAGAEKTRKFNRFAFL